MLCSVVKVGAGLCFFFSSRRRHTRLVRDWSSDVCSSDLVGKAPSATLSPLPDNIYVEENTITALHYGNVALIASGTATLEAAVINIPMVVCYRMSFFSWFLIKKLSKVSFASIVNLIGKKEIVPEFLQNEMTSENLYKALRLLLNDSEKRNSMYTGFSEVRKALGKPGAYTRSAEAILKKHL